jgi:hypothetical protein
VSDKQAFATILASILSAILGGALLTTVIEFIYEATGRPVDSGDDGWGLIWIALSIFSGIAGLVLSAKWARRHFPETAL